MAVMKIRWNLASNMCNVYQHMYIQIQCSSVIIQQHSIQVCGAAIGTGRGGTLLKYWRGKLSNQKISQASQCICVRVCVYECLVKYNGVSAYTYTLLLQGQCQQLTGESLFPTISNITLRVLSKKWQTFLHLLATQYSHRYSRTRTKG